MATFFYSAQQQHHQQPQHHTQNSHSMGQSHNHHGRSRRAPRLSSSQNSHRQFRGPKAVKELVAVEPPSLALFRARFEAGRSFDLDDDLEFCPNLLTLDEVCAPTRVAGPVATPSTLPLHQHVDCDQRQSIHSGSSDRSSLSSGSPDSSPLQHQIQPQAHPALSVAAAAATPAYVSPPSFNSNSNNLKLHQPSAIRTRNAIPIVNPSTGMRLASPPSSISPGVMQQTTAARRW